MAIEFSSQLVSVSPYPISSQEKLAESGKLSLESRQDNASFEDLGLGDELEIESINNTKLEVSVTGLNEHFQQIHRELRFSIIEESGQVIVEVLDTETGEVIRQIPAEETLALARHLEEGDSSGLVEEFA